VTHHFKILEGYRNDVPVRIWEILDAFGIAYSFRPMDHNISGWIERRIDGTYAIAINRDHAESRKRFTAAHELAHYIYHRDLVGEGVGDTRAYRADKSTRPNPNVLPVHERQANNVAANLLMPEQTIARLQASGVTDPDELAKRLIVSPAAMRIRLGLPPRLPQ
jgi:hypothetical protein